MRIEINLDGSLKALLRTEVKAMEDSVVRAASGAAGFLKQDWRGQISAAGLGPRLSNTIRSVVYENQRHNAVGMVWSKAPVIVGAHEGGALIRSPNGFWLAIPLPGAGRGARGKRITPAEWEQKTGRRLQLIYRAGRGGLLVDVGVKRAGNVMVTRRARGGGSRLAAPTTFRNRTVPIFALVPQVKLPKRLNLMAKAPEAAGRFATAVARGWR